jgi:hypothetical protein
VDAALREMPRGAVLVVFYEKLERVREILDGHGAAPAPAVPAPPPLRTRRGA